MLSVKILLYIRVLLFCIQFSQAVDSFMADQSITQQAHWYQQHSHLLTGLTSFSSPPQHVDPAVRNK